MKLEDLRALPAGVTVEADVCIIGSGPAGMSVALELADTNLSVCLVESGGLEDDDAVEGLNTIENVGQRRAAQLDVRRRRFGGTSVAWTGRCAPFDEMDFESRPWVPHSGWPLGRSELLPYLARAAAYLGLAPVTYDPTLWSHLTGAPPSPALDPAVLREQFWQFSAGNDGDGPVDFGQRYRTRVETAPNLRVLVNATVTRIGVSPNGGQVEKVVLRTVDGNAGQIKAGTVVVAGGGIENARLLLASNDVLARGLGNDRDLVGRFLMDHPYADVATVDGQKNVYPVISRFGHYWLDRAAKRHTFLLGMSLSPRAQHDRRLLNCAAYFTPEEPEDAAWPAARRLLEALRSRRLQEHAVRDATNVLNSPLEIAQMAQRRLVAGLPPVVPARRALLGINCEQVPDPSSRLTLSQERDATGVRRSKVDWRINDFEMHTIRETSQMIRAELTRLGLPALEPIPWIENDDAWRERFHDMAHPMGTTRMAQSPDQGVTDTHGRVYGVDGLFVAGSSLFPTGGTANPTLMLVGLALRVADAVKHRHARKAPEIRPTVESGSERLRVALVGAGHRMRTIYLPVLRALSNRFDVVGFTSRSEATRARFSADANAPGFATIDDMVSATRPDLLIVAVTPDANVGAANRSLDPGIPLLLETPLAWSAREGRQLAGRIAAEHRLVGVAEQFPFLPEEQLKRQVIDDGVLGTIVAVHNNFRTYAYHGIAQLRSYLGRGCRPTRVTGTVHRHQMRGHGDSDDAQTPTEWEQAVIEFEGGATASYRFSPAYDAPFRLGAALDIDGELGSMHNGELSVREPLRGQTHQASIRRINKRREDTDSLERVEIDVLGRTVVWDNPFSGSTLSDEQIAVATHLDAMGQAVSRGAPPLYSVQDALDDVEILHAIHLSSERGGAVDLPIHFGKEAARRSLSAHFWRGKYRAAEAEISGRVNRWFGPRPS